MDAPVDAAPIPELPVLKANLRWRRTIYTWISAGAALVCAVFALYLQTGAELEGPVIAVAVACGGMLLVGLALFLTNMRVDSARVVRVLGERPGDVVRVGLKRTESNVAGVDAARYEWIVLDVGTADRLDERLEVLVRQRDLRSVMGEIRACAPSAKFDSRVFVQRTELRF